MNDIRLRYFNECHCGTGSILSLSYCPCGVEHVLCASMWVSSRFPSFLSQPKNVSVGCDKLSLGMNVCVTGALMDRHPIHASFPVFSE